MGLDVTHWFAARGRVEEMAAVAQTSIGGTPDAAASITKVVSTYVRLTPSGQNAVGLCPFHRERTPSFTVSERRGVFYCFGCRAGGDAITFLRRLHGCDFRSARKRLREIMGGGIVGFQKPVCLPRVAEPNGRLQLARRLWSMCRLADGSVVEKYLHSRGIRVPIPASIRFLSGAWHSEARTSFPAMIAVVQDVTGRITGVHRTYLAVDGSSKAAVAPAKKMLGSCVGGAVRLAKIGSTLAITEGIETGLSVLQATGTPTWAALSASGLAALRLPPVPAAETVVVFADHDPAGIAAAEAAMTRWHAEGRRVRLALPPKPGSDFNDVLRGGG